MQAKRVLLAVAFCGAVCGVSALPAAAETPLDGVLPAAPSVEEVPVPPAGAAPAPPAGELPAPPAGELPSLPGAELPALPGVELPAPLGAPAEPEAAPTPAPNRVSPDDCIAGGGNVERPEPDQDVDTTYYCNGGTQDGMGIQH